MENAASSLVMKTGWFIRTRPRYQIAISPACQTGFRSDLTHSARGLPVNATFPPELCSLLSDASTPLALSYGFVSMALVFRSFFSGLHHLLRPNVGFILAKLIPNIAEIGTHANTGSKPDGYVGSLILLRLKDLSTLSPFPNE